jgi:hypothetical protein
MKTIAVLAICFAFPAFAEVPRQYEEAGVILSIASICRADYGDDDLFEAAFLRFTLAAEGVIGAAQIAQVRRDLLDEAGIGKPNMFAEGFCDMIRDDLMP